SHEAEEVGVVVAADQPGPGPLLQGVAYEFQRLTAGWTSVYDVPQEDDARLIAGCVCVLVDGFEERQEQVGTAMDIADGVGGVEHSGSFRTGIAERWLGVG